MIRHISALAAVVVLALSTVACAAPESDGPEDAESAEQITLRSASFSTSQGPDGSFTVRLLAANGELLLTSAPCATPEDAGRAVESIVALGSNPTSFEILATERGFVFTLRTPAGVVVATSDPYASRVSAERGVTTVRGLVRIEQQKATPVATGGQLT